MTLSSRLKEISDRLDAADSGAFDGDDLRRLISAVRILAEGLEKCKHGECIDPHIVFHCKCPKHEALTAAAKVLEGEL